MLLEPLTGLRVVGIITVALCMCAADLTFAQGLRFESSLSGGRFEFLPDGEQPPAPLPLPPDLHVASFEAGEFGELDGESARGSARHALNRNDGYAGQVSLVAESSRGSGFARGWFDVEWSSGSDVWYGAAFLVPSTQGIGYADVLRWDNFTEFGPGGDVGGIEIDDGRAT